MCVILFGKVANDFELDRDLIVDVGFLSHKPNFDSINVTVRRLGGGYGGKISRNTQVACACALVCHKLNRPARFVMSIESNMLSMGKRMASRQEYEVGVDDNGVIQHLNCTTWSNTGYTFNEPHGWLVLHHLEKYMSRAKRVIC